MAWLMRWTPWIIAIAACGAYLAIGLSDIMIFPAWNQDEPWIASVAYSLVTQGTYGSQMFSGYAGMDKHYFDFMPTYPWLLAGLFKLVGIGTFQIRLMPLLCGLLVLLFTFLVGRQVGGVRVGALAIVLLVGQRIMIGTPQTGIPLLDIARIGRYDIAVPLFGLLACAAFNRAEQLDRSRWYVVSGVLIGLAGLTHLYGLFWLPALLIAHIWRRGPSALRSPHIYLLFAGFVVVWLPWVGYVVANWADYLGQMRIVGRRFDLLTLRFYQDNISREPDRYRQLGLMLQSGPDFTRVGGWLAVLGLPVAFGLALWPKRRIGGLPGFSVAIALFVHLLLFTVLFEPKTYSYTIAIWPLLAILLACLGIWVWDLYRQRVVRGVLLGVLLLVLAEGGQRVVVSHSEAAKLSSFDAYMARISAQIPAGARVMGLHNYWFQLRDHPFQTWVVPVLLTEPEIKLDGTIPIDNAIGLFRPDVFLIDRNIAEHLDRLAEPQHPQHVSFGLFWRYMKKHQARLVATIDDPTYGPMQIYYLKQ